VDARTEFGVLDVLGDRRTLAANGTLVIPRERELREGQFEGIEDK